MQQYITGCVWLAHHLQRPLQAQRGSIFSGAKEVASLITVSPREDAVTRRRPPRCAVPVVVDDGVRANRSGAERAFDSPPRPGSRRGTRARSRSSSGLPKDLGTQTLQSGHRMVDELGRSCPPCASPRPDTARKRFVPQANVVETRDELIYAARPPRILGRVDAELRPESRLPWVAAGRTIF